MYGTWAFDLNLDAENILQTSFCSRDTSRDKSKRCVRFKNVKDADWLRLHEWNVYSENFLRMQGHENYNSFGDNFPVDCNYIYNGPQGLEHIFSNIDLVTKCALSLCIMRIMIMNINSSHFIESCWSGCMHRQCNMTQERSSNQTNDWPLIILEHFDFDKTAIIMNRYCAETKANFCLNFPACDFY